MQWIGRGTKQGTVEDIAKVSGVLSAIAEGVTTPDAVWPDRVSAPAGPAPPPQRAPRPPEAPPSTDIPDGPESGSEDSR